MRGGELTASARVGDRWTGRVELAGDGRKPRTADDPLAGFTGHRVRVLLGSSVDTVPTTITAADLLIEGTTVTRSARDYSVSVELTGLATYVDRAAPREWTPQAGETVGAMIGRVVSGSRPPGWAPVPVHDTSTRSSTVVPSDYAARGRSGWQVVTDLATVADVTVYVDRYQRLVIRDPLPDTPSPVRSLSVTDDVIAYTTELGRRRFANRVELRCSPVQVSSDLDELRDDVVGVAEQTTGPLGTGAIGRVIADEQQLTGTISQSDANRRARSLLGPYLRGWLSTELDVLPDVRLDPDDDVTVTYADGTTATHRITELSLPLDTGPMRLACRTL